MNIEKIVTSLLNGRIIDLSKKVIPGKAEGPLDTGKRKYEITPFTFPPGEIMHNIHMESHISTHVEVPSHFIPSRYGRSAKDISEVSLIRFFGIATLVDCSNCVERSAIGAEVLSSFKIKANDIVLIGKCPHLGDKRNYLEKEGVEYLLDAKVKLVGFDDSVYPENPELKPKDLKTYFTHDLLLSNEIPIIEGLVNLGEIKKSQFLFFGFPANMGGLESFPIRALAIEPDV